MLARLAGMDIRKAAFSVFGRRATPTQEVRSDPSGSGGAGWQRLLAKMGGYPHVSWVPRVFTPEAAMKLTAVGGAINTIARSVAQLPLNVIDDGSGEIVDPESDMEANVVARRWTPLSHTAVDGVYHWLRSVLLYGKGGAVIERSTPGPEGILLAIRPINPVGLDRRLDFGTATGVGAGAGEVTYHVIGPTGGEYRVPRDQIMFLAFVPPFDGYTDKSPLDEPWPAVRAGLEAQDWSANFYQKGAQPETYLQSQDSDIETYKLNLRLIHKQFDEMRAGKRREMMLPAGWEVKLGSAANARDADMVNARTLAVQEIARIYDVSPLELKDLSRATYSNFEQASANDAKTAAWWARRIQTQMSMTLWPAGERRVEFDTSELDEVVFQTRIASYRTAIEAGVYTRNQVRVKLGEPESDQEGMDNYQIAPLASAMPTLDVGRAFAPANGNGRSRLAGQPW